MILTEAGETDITQKYFREEPKSKKYLNIKII